MFNFNKGGFPDAELDPKNSFTRDTNSTWALFIRWFLLLNELVWIFVANASHRGLKITGYSFSVVPSIVFILYEIVVHFFRVNDYLLNSLGWFIARMFILQVNLVVFIACLVTGIDVLMAANWFTIAAFLFVEMMISCLSNDKCPNMCKSSTAYDRI